MNSGDLPRFAFDISACAKPIRQLLRWLSCSSRQKSFLHADSVCRFGHGLPGAALESKHQVVDAAKAVVTAAQSWIEFFDDIFAGVDVFEHFQAMRCSRSKTIALGRTISSSHTCNPASKMG